MKLESNTLTTLFTKYARRFKRFSVLLFALVVTGLYGYLVLHIGQALSVEPTPTNQLTTVKPSPRIDEATVQQLEQLQDNSVTVNALFNEGRSNPFQ
jgi:hypothetical protein